MLLKQIRIYRIVVTFAILCRVFGVSLIYAEIVTDGTVGPAGNLGGPDFQITSSLGVQKGGNLFHSFQIFNINTGESATFSGPASVANIVNRVTGGTSSSINGTLRSTIAGADVYLINPSGIIFCTGASLDLQGSFHASTADYIAFENGERFYANIAQTSILSSYPISAFGFLNDNPASVFFDQLTDYLSVPDGKNITITGGNINIDNTVFYTSSGRINLYSAGSKGEVTINPKNGSTVEPHGNINISNNSYVYTSGSQGGDIYIRAGELVVKDSNILSEIEGSGGSGEIDIQADEKITICNSSISGASGGSGDGANINIAGQGIFIQDNSYINASSYFSGQGGNIIITANDSVYIDSGVIASNSYNLGNAGNIYINADNVRLMNGGQINSFAKGRGKGGEIHINAADTLEISGEADDYASGIYVSCEGEGDGGLIDIKSNMLRISGGGKINADADSNSSGNGGDIIITANNSVSITGTYENGEDLLSSISAATSGTGNGGMIQVNTSDLNINDGVIASYSFYSGDAGNILINADNVSLLNRGQISAHTQSAGKGGEIHINASDTLEIAGEINDYASGIYASSLDKGDGGDIFVNTNNLEIINGGRINASTSGEGNAGDITIKSANIIELKNNSAIETSAISADGGNISLQAIDMINLNNSDITTMVQGGLGNGGNISIDLQFLILNNSKIIANAFGGNGGNISIITDYFIADPLSVVTASSELGFDGDIEISSPNIDFTNIAMPVNSSFDTSRILKDICEVKNNMNSSSLILGGRNGVQVGPGSPLYSVPDELYKFEYLIWNKE